jgi:hypothetical protein
LSAHLGFAWWNLYMRVQIHGACIFLKLTLGFNSATLSTIDEVYVASDACGEEFLLDY